MGKLRAGIKLLSAVLLVLLYYNVSCSATDEERRYFAVLESEMSALSAEDSIEMHDYVLISEEELREHIESGTISWYEEDYEVELFEGSDEGSDAQSWHLNMINSDIAEEIGCMGQDVRIAVIDSGANSHPDLINNLCEGYNYLNSTVNTADNIGHGTFVSGLIAAEVSTLGPGSVSPRAEIVPLKCFDTGVTTTVSKIKAAIYDAVDKYGCDVINMSFGMKNHSTVLEAAVNYAVGNNVTVVAAAGNSGTQVLNYPAAFENVIGVGSVNSDGEKSSFSQYNESVFVTAPGEGVMSTDKNNGYSTKNGTSFSAPIVSAAIAVMKNIDGKLTAEKAMEIIKNTSVDKGDAGYDTSYGYGIINLKNIAEYMLSDIKYFISPIMTDDEKSTVTVLNNTEEIFSGICMWGNYKGTLMEAMDGFNIELEPNSVQTVSCGFTKNKIKCIIWKGITDISVIADTREREEI